MPAAAWYLRSKEGQPLGFYLQERELPVPVVGERIASEEAQHRWRVAEVLASEKLARVCSMRRYSVTVRVLEWREDGK